MTKALVLDERRRVREALRELLVDVHGIDQVDTVVSAEELLERYPSERPDVVLIGSQRALTSGVETCRRLLAHDPGAVIILVGAPDDAPTVAAAVAAGARGYLRWDASPMEVSISLSRVGTRSGSDVEPPGLRPLRPVRPSAVTLTEREMQVLLGMSQGKSNAAIGRDLYLSEDTVKTHARRLFKKLTVSDRAESVATGFRLGLLS